MNDRTVVTTNAMTVDVEDYFQVSAFEAYVSRANWKYFSSRVESNTDRILQLFADSGVQATFFTLGWVAEHYPGLVKRIVLAGHDLASHGYEHQRVTNLTKCEFANDLTTSKAVLEDVGGVEISGYRAPSYSFTSENLWAHEVLFETGYRYSSSIVPIKHDLYGIPDAPRFAHQYVNGCVLELPITTISILGRKISCGGGGWFRLYPYRFSKWAINQVNHNDNQSAIFYFHPWEIDPKQPRIKNLDARTKFRHYQNLSRMEGKINRLLRDFRWRSVPEVFAKEIESVQQS